jgi:hypothetical protein
VGTHPRAAARNRGGGRGRDEKKRPGDARSIAREKKMCVFYGKETAYY